jgi:methyl coenzyme M reductase subunit C
MAGFAPPESVDTKVVEMAGFARAAGRRPRPGTTMPAALRWPLMVSRRTPIVRSMRRRDQPNRPSATIGWCLSSAKTLLMPRKNTVFLVGVNASSRYSKWPFCPVHRGLDRATIASVLQPETASGGPSDAFGMAAAAAELADRTHRNISTAELSAVLIK